MSGTVNVRSKARECSITAVVTRADGTTENLGEIAYWHKNPLRRIAFRMKRLFRRS